MLLIFFFKILICTKYNNFPPQDTKARGRSSDLRVVFLRALPGFHPTLSFSTFKQQKLFHF